MKTQREKFEAWAVANDYNTMRKDDTAYLMTSTTLSWKAWQAAIESVVVELPKIQAPSDDNEFSEGCHCGKLLYQYAVSDHLDEIGLRWKL